MTKAFLIRIEGVNLGATVYDTNDLSTIRGASLALLRHATRWPERLSKDLPTGSMVEEIVVGASDGIYRLIAPDGWDLKTAREHVNSAIATAIKAPPRGDDLERTLPYLTFTWAVIAQGDHYKNDVAEMIARCRQMQLQQLTVDVPDEPQPGNSTCPYDRTRPADTKHDNQEGDTVFVSAAVDARRVYGRTARQKFYGVELDADPEFGFADSFSDLLKVKLPPEGKIDEGLANLPPALSGKMAVVYLDGNSFTKIREAVIFEACENAEPTAVQVQARQSAFSRAVWSMRRDLLRALLQELEKDSRMFFKPTDRQTKWDNRPTRLKFETLLWGGDEALFVLPAWRLMGLLPVLAKHLDSETWKLQLKIDGETEDTGYQLTHAVGIVLCNIKTPIAVLRALAEDVANGSKDLAKTAADGGDLPITGLRNVYSIQILESVEPPRANLEAFRRQLYGTADPAAFTLIGKCGVDTFLSAARALQGADGGLPRSQLYKLIQSARQQGLIGNPDKEVAADAIAAFDDEIAQACQRSGCKHENNLRSVDLGWTKDAPLMPLMRLAEFWDYLDPFDETQNDAAPAETGAAA